MDFFDEIKTTSFKTKLSKATCRLCYFMFKEHIDKSVNEIALIPDKFKRALIADSKNPYGIEVNVVILNYASTITPELSKRLLKANKKPLNLYKKTTNSYLTTEANSCFYKNQVIMTALSLISAVIAQIAVLFLAWYGSDTATITRVITLKSGETSMLNSISISVKSDGDHKSRIINSMDLALAVQYSYDEAVVNSILFVELSNLGGINSISMRPFLINVTIAKDCIQFLYLEIILSTTKALSLESGEVPLILGSCSSYSLNPVVDKKCRILSLIIAVITNWYSSNSTVNFVNSYIVAPLIATLFTSINRNRSDITTIYGGLRLTSEFGRSIFISIILKSREALLKNSISISVKSDGAHKSRIRSELRTNYEPTSEFVRSPFKDLVLLYYCDEATVNRLVRIVIYYSVTIRSYAISWYKVENQKCRILSLIIAQIAVLILASIGRDALAQKSDVISALSNSGEWHEKIRRLELILFIIKAPILKDKRKRHFMIYEVFGCVNLYNVCSAILIVEFEDTICRFTPKLSLYFKKIIQGWCLCLKPIVWPVIYLVLTMNQMLTGPGKK